MAEILHHLKENNNGDTTSKKTCGPLRVASSPTTDQAPNTRPTICDGAETSAKSVNKEINHLTEVGSWSHYFHKFTRFQHHPSWLSLGFLDHQQYEVGRFKLVLTPNDHWVNRSPNHDKLYITRGLRNHSLGYHYLVSPRIGTIAING